VSWFGKEASFLQLEAERACIALAVWLHDDRIEQPSAAHARDRVRVNALEGRAEEIAHPCRILRQVLIAQDLQGGDGDGAAERVAAVRGSVLPGVDREHDLVAGEDRADGVHAAGESLAEKRAHQA